MAGDTEILHPSSIHPSPMAERDLIQKKDPIEKLDQRSQQHLERDPTLTQEVQVDVKPDTTPEEKKGLTEELDQTKSHDAIASFLEQHNQEKNHERPDWIEVAQSDIDELAITASEDTHLITEIIMGLLPPAVEFDKLQPETQVRLVTTAKDFVKGQTKSILSEKDAQRRENVGDQATKRQQEKVAAEQRAQQQMLDILNSTNQYAAQETAYINVIIANEEIDEEEEEAENAEEVEHEIIIDAGAAELREHGHSAEELKQMGFSADALLDVGYTETELTSANYTESELTSAGVSVSSEADTHAAVGRVMESMEDVNQTQAEKSEGKVLERMQEKVKEEEEQKKDSRQSAGPQPKN